MEKDFKVDVSGYYPSSLLGESKAQSKQEAVFSQSQSENQTEQQNFSQNSMGTFSPLSALAKNLFGGEGVDNLLSALSSGKGAGLLSMLKNFSMQKSDDTKQNLLSSLFSKKTNDDNAFSSQGKIESFKKVFDDD